MLCARLKMMIESFVRRWVLGNFSMIPHVFLMFSIDYGFNVCCVCVFNVFVCSVLSWCLLKKIKSLCAESQKEDGTKESVGF
jgi:hypothetical protein